MLGDGLRAASLQGLTTPRIDRRSWTPGGATFLVVYNKNMKREVVVQMLKNENPRLSSQFGVKSLLLFGSVARDEATPTSDVDLLVEFSKPVGYFGLFSLQEYLEKLLNSPVDLGTPESLKPRLRERIMGEAVRVA